MADKTTEFIKMISKNVKDILDERNISQKHLVELCENQGYNISQATISHIINGKKNSSIGNILAVAEALNVDIRDLLTADYSNPIKTNSNKKSITENQNNLLVSDPSDRAFNGYLGTYHILFYKTKDQNDELVKGKLTFEEDKKNKKCVAKLVIDAGERTKKEENSVTADKKYFGSLIISHSMHSAYAYLCSENIGEVCMLVFHHWYINNSSLKCTMACAITTSAGSNRRPTIHRMCITKDELSGEVLELVKGQLLLNNPEIILSEKQLDILLLDEAIPDSFKEILQRSAQKNRCVCIQESSLYDSTLSEKERIKWISYVRAQSKGQKYNKISKRTEDVLASLLGVE
ncbi:MAG: helix-turn-helix transcriptional regulator [Lachnospiraceae bacterium]|nr:helix-turn-helix transcriptional regulator [Lachnospiraceae bacterium]